MEQDTPFLMLKDIHWPIPLEFKPRKVNTSGRRKVLPLCTSWISRAT